MERNEHDIFDELVRGKLTNYSEPPEPEWIHSIQAKKNRAVNLYHLYKLMLIAVIVGAGMFAGIQLMPYQLEETTSTQMEQSGSDLPVIDLNQNAQPATAEFASATAATQTNTVNTVSSTNTSHTTATYTTKQGETKSTNTTSTKNTRSSFVKKHTQTSSPAKATQQPTVVKSENTGLLPTENKNREPEKTETEKTTTEKPEASAIPCKAAFDYYTSYSGEFNFVHTAQITENATIEWNFGDGTISGAEKAKHMYKRSGTYEVTLTITDKDDACSFSKTIAYQNPDEKTTPITISGKLVAGSALLKNGIVELYVFDENKGQFKSAQNIRTNQSGEYAILLQRNKRYLLKGYPTADVQNYVATYWGNSTESEDASEILIMPSEKDQLIGFNIDLMKIENPDLYAPVENPITTNTNHQQVFLVDGNNNIIGTGSVDEKGNFTINGNVPAGDYTIVNPSNGSTSSKTVAKASEVVSGNIFDNQANSSSPSDKITVYPNPAGNTVNFGINSTSEESATIIVTDAAGVELSRTRTTFIAGYNQTQHDLSNYPPGIYYVLVFKGSKQVLSNRVVKVDNSK